MCLTTKYREPKIASCNIECFKVIIRGHGMLFTPYRHIEVKVPCTMTAAYRNLLPREDSLFKVGGEPRYEVTGEGVHAYTVLKAAKIEALHLDHYHLCYIVRCIVPTGTKYWIGENDDIASSEMRIEEIIY